MNNENKLGFLNLTVIILTLYVLGALVADTFWQLPTETSKLLTYFDYLICAFFFSEFLYRFVKADSKLAFMKWGWIDLLSSIPMVDFLRAGRLLRLIRLLRVIRAFRSTRQLLNHIFANKAKGTLTSVSILAVLLKSSFSISYSSFKSETNCEYFSMVKPSRLRSEMLLKM